MNTIVKKIEVADLYPGATVTGTGPSGDYEDGPRILVAIVEAPEHSRRTTAYHLQWDDGTSNIYYGDTLVTVAALGGSQ